MTTLTRRDFIKLGAKTCLAAGALPIIGCARPQCDPSDEGHKVYAILGDELSDLYQMGADAAQSLGINAGLKLSGARVFIKPNLFILGAGLNTYMPINGSFTKAEILFGIAEQCLMAGADKVTIGDGAQGLWWNWKWLRFLPGNTIYGTDNLKDAVDRLKAAYPHQEVELACLNWVNEWEYIPSSSDAEVMQEGIKVARSFYESDHMISVPVMKTHGWADISCAMKNYVGVITTWPPYGNIGMRVGVHSAYANAFCGGFDNAGIAGCFTDIYKWRKAAGKEDFAVIDCAIGVEGMGPQAIPVLADTVHTKRRSPIGKYFLLAAKNPVVADAAVVRVMGQDVYEVKQLVMADNMELGPIDRTDFCGAGLEQLRIRNFNWPFMQAPEWGVFSTVPASSDPSIAQNESGVINTLAGLSLPGGMIYCLKRLHEIAQANDDEA